jgi:uncharacterized protein involved in type VI secretion and phage assembly
VAGETFGAQPILYLDGNRLPQELEASVRRVLVESDVLAPDSCKLVLADPGRSVLADGGFAFHATLAVKAARTGEQSEQPLFEGRIYSLGFDLDERGATATVTAYDHSYALFSGLHTATYRDVTDSDLARQIAKEAGLDAGAIEATSVVHEHVSQVNETHWDFLVRRAREIDYEVRADGNKLDFRRPTKAQDAPDPGDYHSTGRLQLTPGGNLEQLTARVTAAQQVTEVEVRGWDPQNKRELVATAPGSTRGASLEDRPEDLASGNGDPRQVTTTLPLSTQAECDAAAASEAERVASSSVYAQGIAKGDPRIVAGAAISIGQTGGRFDGKLTVTQATHDFGPAGYRTRFTVGGRHDRSVFGLLNRDGGAGGRRHGTGVVPGIVTNVTDPDKLGRVKVKLPWLSDDYESHWARVLQLGAALDRGLLLLPEVNDEVLVAFEHGDTRKPYVLGGVFNGVDTPPFSGGVDGGSGKVVTRGLRTRKGHQLVLSDDDGKEKIEIATVDAKVRILLDHAGGALKIDASGDVEVNAGGKATVTAGSDLRVEAKGSATVKATSGLTLQSSGEVAIKGKVIKLN